MKIYIIGSVGSGKTTYAQRIANTLEIPHFETDNFVWQRRPEGDLRRNEEHRDRLFLKAVATEKWVIEGVHIGWTDAALDRADFIVFLDMPYHIRTKRFVLRYFRQKAGREKANYKPHLGMLRKMFRWNRYFEQVMKPGFLRKLEYFPEKARILTNRKDAEKFMHFLEEQKISID